VGSGNAVRARNSPLFEVALVLVRLDHVASLIRKRRSRHILNMKRINVGFFYNLGNVIRPLINLPNHQSYLNTMVAIISAESEIKAIVEGSPIALKTCLPEAKELLEWFNTLRAIENRDPDVSEISKMRVYARHFESTLRTELRDLEIYFVSPVGIYSTTALLSNAVAMFGDAAALLPKETAIEFNEAGKCLAFSLYTAAGFHLLRAVESAVRIYYDVLAKGAARPTRGSMGVYLDELLKLSGVDTDLESVLRQIKRLHRDPIAHPDAVLSQTEATSLIGIAHSAISRIIELARPKKP